MSAMRIGVLLCLLCTGLALALPDSDAERDPVWYPDTTVPAGSLPSPLAAPDGPLEHYLARVILRSSVGEVGFCALDSMGNETRHDTTFVYLWALCAAFDSVSADSLGRGSATSMPVVVAELITDSTMSILGRWEPQDGDGYGPSIRKMLPEKYVGRALGSGPEEYNARADSLEREVIRKARSYFGMPPAVDQPRRGKITGATSKAMIPAGHKN
jgi:hypothetical protein